MNRISIIFFLIIINTSLLSKDFNTFNSFYHFNKTTEKEKKHSPHKASIYSAVLPGLGQAYNKKYWKIPIVYVGLGASTYFMLSNRKELQERQNVLNLYFDGDDNTKVPEKYINTDIDVVKAERDFHRKNRDYGIIAIAGFYLINIVDAAIDAHFYGFDIDKPLAQQKKKNWHLHASQINRTPALGLRIMF
ncbi:MAG: DUF5683 domain-containing protein [Bacteroidota bacterium]|nr:DUF5683 domain-containing protein [Bacteroidota bacterium]